MFTAFINRSMIRMKQLQRIPAVLWTTSHVGDISSKIFAAGFCVIHQFKHLHYKESPRFSARQSSETSRKPPTSSVNLIELPWLRYFSGQGLASRYSWWSIPRRSANHDRLSLSNLFLVGLHKRRHCSRYGLALMHCGTGSPAPTNNSAVSLSNLSLQIYRQKWRHCSKNRLARKWSNQIGYYRDMFFLSNPLMTTFLQKRFCSGTGLAFSDAFGSSRPTNREAVSTSNPYLKPHLPKSRLCSATTGLVSSCCYGTGSRESTNGDSLSMSNPSLRAYLEHLAQEHQQIGTEMMDGQTAADGKKLKRLSRRLTELTPLVKKTEDWKNKQTELREIDELISGVSSSTQDKEMRELALLEKDECLEDADSLEQEIVDLLTPVYVTDDNDIIMEFSAGVGGQEAMLFAADMFKMYEAFAAYRNWDIQKLEYFTTDLGGLRHASVSVSGDGAYKLMKQEAGVHRVQRVPKTEKAGRIHTSTMAVAVLPQPKEIDLKLDPKDLRIETKKASGAGGQHVNTTDSAVRIVHIPTGFVAESQQERSQLKNRSIAMVMLQTKIYNSILEKREATERSVRRSQVGTSGRSEKIRTYNFQQDRVTDHRVGQSMFDVEGFLSGGESLDEMISCLVKEEEKEMVARILDEFQESQKKT